MTNLWNFFCRASMSHLCHKSSYNCSLLPNVATMAFTHSTQL